MDSSLATRMFHTLVVMGAALGAGCGPQAPPNDQGDSSGAGPGTTHDATTTPGSTAPGTGTPGDPSQATTIPADPATGDVTTTTTDTAGTTVHSATSEAPTTGAPETTEPGTSGPINGPEDCAHPQDYTCDDNFENCFCNPDAPLTPDDCRSPNQFVCQQPWSEPPLGCACDPNAPAVPEDCPFPINFNCAQYDPIAIGCSCECRFFGPPNPQSEDDCKQVGPFWCTHEPVACCCQIQLG